MPVAPCQTRHANEASNSMLWELNPGPPVSIPTRLTNKPSVQVSLKNTNAHKHKTLTNCLLTSPATYRFVQLLIRSSRG